MRRLLFCACYRCYLLTIVADWITTCFCGTSAIGPREVVDAIRKVKTGSKGFHQDVPVDDVIIEKAVVVE